MSGVGGFSWGESSVGGAISPGISGERWGWYCDFSWGILWEKVSPGTLLGVEVRGISCARRKILEDFLGESVPGDAFGCGGEW